MRSMSDCAGGESIYSATMRTSMTVALAYLFVLPLIAAPAKKTMTKEAEKFVAEAEAQLAEVNVEQQRAAWVAENFITYDTQILSAQASEKQINLGVDLAKKAARFDHVKGLPYDVRRKLDLIKLSLNTPGPADPRKTAEMAKIAAEMDAMYGAGKYCPQPDHCLDVEAITKIMQTSRDPQQLLEMWSGWHTVSRPM